MNEELKAKFETYPPEAASILLKVRETILDLASEFELGPVEETLKWGEPSYLVKGGSTVRFDWKAKHPDSCFVFFHCQTHLIETFSELYNEQLQFQGKRAIVLELNAPIAWDVLKHCLSLALRYHSLKSKPLLGC